MTFPLRMTEEQKRTAYRVAVQLSLEEFYGKPSAESKGLADAWWDRMNKTAAFDSGFFFHDEPINTAARILRAETVEIGDGNQAAYEDLLRRSERFVLNGKVQGAQSRSYGGAIAKQLGTTKPATRLKAVKKPVLQKQIG